MIEDYSELRGERRSFFCPNKLWNELQEKTKDLFSISVYIKQAVFEKMVREEPEKKDYFKELFEY